MTSWGNVYCAASFPEGKGQHHRAALGLVAVPAEEADPARERCTVTPGAVTNPQAVAFAVLYALDLLAGKPAVLWVNIDCVAMNPRDAESRLAFNQKYNVSHEPPPAFEALKNTLAARLLRTGSEIRWLPDSADNPHFARAKQIATARINAPARARSSP